MKTIFITSVGGDVACAILRCLRQLKEEYKFIGSDMNKYVQGKMYIDDFFISPAYSNEELYFEFIKDICLKNKVDFFLPVGEKEIIIASKHREFFKENNIKLVIVNDEIIKYSCDKYKTYELCKEIGLNVPNTIRLEEFKKDNKLPFDFPIVLKKASGSGAKGMKIINSKEELLEIIDDYEEGWILQKMVGTKAEEYTMGVFSDGVNVNHITFKRKLGFGSMSVEVKTVKDDKFKEISELIAHRLNLVGSINVQMRKENDGYYIFEINPRLSSSCHFRHLNGFKDALWWIELLDNKKPNISFEAIDGKVGIKVLDEILF